MTSTSSSPPSDVSALRLALHFFGGPPSASRNERRLPGVEFGLVGPIRPEATPAMHEAAPFMIFILSARDANLQPLAIFGEII